MILENQKDWFESIREDYSNYTYCEFIVHKQLGDDKYLIEFPDGVEIEAYSQEIVNSGRL